MTTRRTFLGAVAGGTAAATAFRGVARAAGSVKPPLGLQLWSVRAMLEKDVAGTLRQVKAWGFDEVETFGTFGAEIAPQLKAAGLKVRAMHIGYDRLSGDMAGVLRDADAVGATTLVNPYLPHQAKPFASREEILKAAGDFAKWSKQCRAAGKRFGYHIHGQEFGPAPEGTLFDVLARESGPDVGFEADVYWVTFGGVDPVALMKSHPGRVWFTHLKDMAKGVAPGSEAGRREESNVVLGTGQIDIKGIVAAGPKAGVEMHFIEDESADPAGQIPKSVAFYKSL
ncbi:MAG TPA: sugar phosphate isomerase/epimerase [Vicinamibacteria bacterium]|nr:sugar phosphate isomerase/epimerase [Vicinamibacteria bacterium]